MSIAAQARIAVIANRKSGTNARDRDAIDRAMAVLKPQGARLWFWKPKTDPRVLVDQAIAEGAEIIVAAGGDGTAMAIASAVQGSSAAFSVLPLGTFNYFARGLGLPETPEDAAGAIASGHRHRIAVGTVNGHVFLNNASLGLYPAVLMRREFIYARWGRRRIMAHWSVVASFLRFQRPMRLVLHIDGTSRAVRTPLLFVARSTYQLEMFGLEGRDAIEDDSFAVLVARGETRGDLFRTAWRLVTRKARQGRDYQLLRARTLTVETRRKRTLLAFDGEKCRASSPFVFRMAEEPLDIILPGDIA